MYTNKFFPEQKQTTIQLEPLIDACSPLVFSVPVTTFSILQSIEQEQATRYYPTKIGVIHQNIN
jgi:hypothetical protein